MEKLREKTAEYPVLREILLIVREGQKPSKEERKSLGRDGNYYIYLFETLKEENGILYMYPPVVNGARKQCIPDSLHENAFTHAHPVSSHLGINKTSGMLAERFLSAQFIHLCKSKNSKLCALSM